MRGISTPPSRKHFASAPTWINALCGPQRTGRVLHREAQAFAVGILIGLARLRIEDLIGPLTKLERERPSVYRMAYHCQHRRQHAIGQHKIEVDNPRSRISVDTERLI
jgi:hypothetical protein